MNVDPRMARDMKEWVEYTTGPLSTLIGTVPILGTDIEWQEWAYLVTQVPSVQMFLPPDPRHFTNWSDWATRFNQAVPL